MPLERREASVKAERKESEMRVFHGRNGLVRVVLVFSSAIVVSVI